MPLSAFAQTLTGRIVSIGDDDTLRVTTGEETITVRLACVDAPETAQAPFGKVAAQRLQQLLPVGEQVTLQLADTDRYGRAVAKVFKGSRSINLILVQEGLAVVYREYFDACPELRERLLAAEANAKSRKLGFWNQANPILPADFRHGTRANSPAKPSTTRIQPQTNSLPAGDYSCSDFKTQAQAQAAIRANSQLDRDKDGVACESLP